MTNEDKTLTKLDKAIAIKNEQMKEGVHYGKVVDNQSDRPSKESRYFHRKNTSGGSGT